MKNILNFFISKVLYINLGIILLVIIIGLILFNSWLSSYTSHNEKLQVPDFSNMEYEAAQTFAEQHHLKLKIIDTLYVEDIRPGAIIDHSPKKGAFVKENRTIFVSINSKTPILISMPNAVNVSLRQATQILERCGLKVGNLKFKPDFADNYVFEQKYNNRTIKIGTKIPKGTKIDLIVGKSGENEQIFIPNLIDQTLENAQTTLSGLGLNVNTIFGQDIYENGNDSLNSLIWKQAPVYEEGKTMMVGETIDIWVKKNNTEVEITE